MFSRIVPLCVVFLLFAAFVPAQDAKKELEALQGDWTLEFRELNGKKLDLQFKLTIKGDQWLVKFDDTKKTFKIDPSKNPKTIDFIMHLEGKDSVSVGIYKLEGDLLTICLRHGTYVRPTEIKSDGATLLYVWKREKK